MFISLSLDFSFAHRCNSRKELEKLIKDLRNHPDVKDLHFRLFSKEYYFDNFNAGRQLRVYSKIKLFWSAYSKTPCPDCKHIEDLFESHLRGKIEDRFFTWRKITRM